ncbi:MAG: hypothetical protein PUP93_23785 [Rhizonema sp. NSF051]|nr:hypothetical protein [Rhizonema sp. NSF051]
MPPPPSPPDHSREILAKLADYYRQLAEYHERSAEIAAKQLFHLEALLNPMLSLNSEASADSQITLSTPKKHNIDNDKGDLNNLESEPNSGLFVPNAEQLADDTLESLEAELESGSFAPTAEQLADDTLESLESELESGSFAPTAEQLADDTLESLEAELESGSFAPTAEQLADDTLESLESEPIHDESSEAALIQEMTAHQAISNILEANKGKILQIDYLIWELYGQMNEKDHMSVKTEVERVLSQGEKEGSWYAIPDSPGCWTVDLSYFPDLASNLTKVSSTAKKSSTKKKTSNTNNKSPQARLTYSRLPYSPKLEQYVTLTAALAQILQESYPQAMNIDAILQWFYPDGLSSSERKQARASINDMLNKGSGYKGWKRVKAGQYMWDAPVPSSRR